MLCTLSVLDRLTSSNSMDLVEFRLQLPVHGRSRRFPQSHSLPINASLSFTEMSLVTTARKLSLVSGANAWIVLVRLFQRIMTLSYHTFLDLDYDLCTPCIQSGAAERHNPFHEFFDIETPGKVFVHTVFSGRGERAASTASRPTSINQPRSSTAIPLNVVEPIRHFAACNLCDSTIVGDRFVSPTVPIAVLYRSRVT